jgi:hypothetical protein
MEYLGVSDDWVDTLALAVAWRKWVSTKNLVSSVIIQVMRS